MSKNMTTPDRRLRALVIAPVAVLIGVGGRHRQRQAH
jgi:hypothetical protein